MQDVIKAEYKLITKQHSPFDGRDYYYNWWDREANVVGINEDVSPILYWLQCFDSINNAFAIYLILFNETQYSGFSNFQDDYQLTENVYTPGGYVEPSKTIDELIQVSRDHPNNFSDANAILVGNFSSSGVVMQIDLNNVETTFNLKHYSFTNINEMNNCISKMYQGTLDLTGGTEITPEPPEPKEESHFYHMAIKMEMGEYFYPIENFVAKSSIVEDTNYFFGNAPATTVSFDTYDSGPYTNGSIVQIYKGVEDKNGDVNYTDIIGIYKLSCTEHQYGHIKRSWDGVDAMVYALSGIYNSTLDWSSQYASYTVNAVLTDIANQSGISYHPQENYPLNAVFSSEPKGLSYRQVIAYGASLCGYNAIIGYHAISSDYYPMFEMFNFTEEVREDVQVDDDTIYESDGFTGSIIGSKIGYLKTVLNTDTDEALIDGDIDDAFGITIFNPYMKQAWNTRIYTKIKNRDKTLYDITVKFLGDWSVKLGDTIKITNNGLTFNLPVMSLEQSCDGGLVTTISSYLKDTDESDGISSATYNPVESVYNSQAVRKDMSSKVDKVDGKGLSTNDFTDDYKSKLDDINLSDYLPLSGGTMNGEIKRNGNAIVNKGTDGSTNFSGGTNLSDGAVLILRGKDQDNYKGLFELRANDGTNNVSLVGKSDGSLTWDSKTILRSDNYNNYTYSQSDIDTKLDEKQDNGNYLIASAVDDSITIDALYEAKKGTTGGSGSVLLVKKDSGIGSNISAGWYNYMYLPHRTGIGGDNPDYATILLFPMTFTGAGYVCRFNKTLKEVNAFIYNTSLATSSSDGLMSTSDKIKLDNIEAQATKTTIVNNLTTTTTGSALDATQGKELKGQINNLHKIYTSPTEIGCTYTSTLLDVYNALPNGSIAMFDGSLFTDSTWNLPITPIFIKIFKSTASRISIEAFSKSTNKMYFMTFYDNNLPTGIWKTIATE